MSLLALLAAKTASDEEILSQLNEAVMQLQVEALGKSDRFGLRPEDVQTSRKKVTELLQLLKKTLVQTGELQFVIPRTPQEGAVKDIVLRLEGKGRPWSDWAEDIDATVVSLQHCKPLSDKEWALLEDIVDLLDEELAEDLRELSRQ